MDHIWQWAWDRYGARYSWAIYVVSVCELLSAYLVLSLLIVALEKSDRYVEAAVATIGTVLVMVYVSNLPGLGGSRLVERWAAGREVDRARALDATYTWSRTVGARALGANAVFIAVLFLLVGAIAGATGSRLVQYATLGATSGILVVLIAVHSYPEAAMRPARVALAGDTGIGDSLPRSRPTFAAWSNLTVLAAAFAFAVMGAMVSAMLEPVRQSPVVFVMIGCVLTLGLAVPLTVGASFAPSLQPLRDLSEGTERVSSGHYNQRLPVVQDDDLGALAASFNRMQAGLAERQRLHAAFGTYVDPALAARFLAQGDDVLTGERRVVPVMLSDIRDLP